MGPLKTEKAIDVYILPTKSSEKEKPSSPKTFWHVDKEMLRFKIHYFLYIGGVAAGIPYTVVLAKDRLGISASSLGAVLTTQMFLFVFSKTIIGYLADYFNKLKLMISIFTIVNVACFFLILALPKIEVEKFHSSSEEVLKSTLKTHDISCEKYQKMFFEAASKNISNVSSFEFSSSNFSKPLFFTEFDSRTCYSFSEDNFQTVLLDYIKLHAYSNAYYLNQTEREIPSTINFSNRFKISVFLSESAYINSKMCQFSSISSLSNSSENMSHKIVEESCTFESKSLAKYNSYSDVELHCAKCDFQNKTLDPLLRIPNKAPRKKDIETYQFWIFSLLYTISGVFANAIFTLSDTACFESIQKHGGDFGQQRLWGGIGWGSIAPLAGFINDYTNDFLAGYTLMAAMMALFLWNMSKLDLVKPHFSQNILKDVGTVLRSKEFLIFEAVVFVNGLGTGMIWYYLIWFLTSIGGSELLCGLTLTVQSFCGVIPFMFFSGWIIKKFGHFNILIVALVGYTIRFLWYSYLQNPWLVLPVEFLHGVTYGLYYTALASYAKMSAKPGTEATTQAIIFSTHEGLGSGIGCVLSGIGFDYFGGHQTFFYSSMLCLCGATVALMLSMHLRSRKGIISLASA